MATILLAYEFGAGLGHLNRLVALAERLPKHHSFVFVVPQAAAHTTMVHQKLGKDVVVKQGLEWKVLDNANADKVPTSTLADAIRLFEFSDPGKLAQAVAFWRKTLKEIKPELIISDFAPALRLAVDEDIPVVVAGMGYTVPPQGRPLPPLRPWQTEVPANSRANEAELLCSANRVRSSFGGGAVHFLSDLFGGKETFISTIAEFDPYRAYRTSGTLAPFNIPDIRVGRPLAERDGPAIFVYLSRQHPHLQQVLTSISETGLPTHVYVAGVEPARLAKAVRRNVIIHTKPADFADIMPRSKVLLHHGGLGTAFAGLIAGTAQLLLPLRLEHFITSRAVVELGGGQVIEGKTTVEAIRSALEKLVVDERISSAARRVGERMNKLRSQDSRDIIVTACERLLYDHTRAVS